LTGHNGKFAVRVAPFGGVFMPTSVGREKCKPCHKKPRKIRKYLPLSKIQHQKIFARVIQYKLQHPRKIRPELAETHLQTARQLVQMVFPVAIANEIGKIRLAYATVLRIPHAPRNAALRAAAALPAQAIV